MSDLATLQTRLAEAEAAHHQLMTGGMVDTVEIMGSRKVRYMLSDAPKLISYISMLKNQIAALSDAPGSRRRRALTVTL